ncbi:metallophosphoesterase 1 homolog [Vanessa cardui]|uniref:metallophosphoesterase 1 homolog n=1 Tax=Vanessa cardui TaxID=171605 RepID=UPI001F141DE9|nr:metallophosphoesterase 1 homolog [Vanessa cardui]
MRRITKKLLILFGGLILIGFYCECLIYYVVTIQCSWPHIETNHSENEVLKAFILADTHLLGPYRGHWLDKWRREWQMHQAFQAIITLHKPDIVFVLGDLFDEGEWTDNKQFKNYVKRFFDLFSLPSSIKMYVVVGNHDIGFHHRIRRGFAQRFSKLLKAPSVQHIAIKNNHFVLLNSMALEGDSCNLCTEARKQIENVSDTLLKCSKNSMHCFNSEGTYNYSQPILMQHFPLYRVSDAVCTEPDAPPLPERNKLFRLKIDALSLEATKYLIKKIKPRAAFGGHTHHGCLVEHYYEDIGGSRFLEYSVPSFSWRNRPDPKYILATIAPDAYEVEKCGLPRETTLILTAVIMICVLIRYVLRTRLIGRGRYE